ncbi:hypothetical protein [Photobacterium lipolyticum]|uniref:Tyr recombinase domain-containing protein n=1 Tax=Photobacterium lipolyticum TaxID=266810 RepID=A0A2T3MQP0_9GAMM|nr:hypothetical protein [Photobacterium lipolyticum]PSV99563.1 hypothetical protein C9I89_21675 [Photobacterium lipolyticum]
MRQLKTYIETIRAGFPAAKTHEMVFVSEMDTQGTEGQPFSLSSFDALFATLSNALSFKIHPHLLRHKWNELFTEAAEDQGLSSDELDKLRKYAMGWSRNSTMGQLYNEFKDAEAVRELQRARQERIVTAGDEGHE